MSPQPELPETVDAICEGGDLDCGSGLLLIIREAMAPLGGGGIMEVRSNDSSVGVDLPAWCRLVGHAFLGSKPGEGRSTSHFLAKKQPEDESLAADQERARNHAWRVRVRALDDEPVVRAYARNHSFDVGQPASFDTEEAAPGALEYLLGALGGCLAQGLRWRASQRGIAIYALEVTLTAKLHDPFVYLGLSEGEHAGLQQVEGRLFLDSDADEAVLLELWDEVQRRSPLLDSLRSPIPVHIERKTTS
ncbi:MAG: OsmC family protein [Planctomycetes bacterium]|nr:OsmC family protein [Planctomycetota bacterium]HRV82468.1 OsmC family protein [Planctomycetota bacterium]